MEALEYRPDVAARSMRTVQSDRRLRGLGHLEPTLRDHREGGRQRARSARLLPRPRKLGERPGARGRPPSVLRQRRLDGLIAAVADERAPGLAERLDGFVTVLFDRDAGIECRRGLVGSRRRSRRGARATRRARPSPSCAHRRKRGPAREPGADCRVPAAPCAPAGPRSAGWSGAPSPGARAVSLPLGSCSRQRIDRRLF